MKRKNYGRKAGQMDTVRVGASYSSSLTIARTAKQDVGLNKQVDFDDLPPSKHSIPHDATSAHTAVHAEVAALCWLLV